MIDPENPTPPEPPSEPQPAPTPAPQPRPTRGYLPGDPRIVRRDQDQSRPPRPERDRPRVDKRDARPPSLEAEQSTHRVSLRDLDASIEDELNAAMSGFSNESYGTAEKPGPRKPADGPAPRKKGKVIGIHGADVFVEVPGGRSQGVLPVEQFEEGPPQIGQEVEVDIEGYDNANGLLLLTRKGAAISVDWSSVQAGQVVEARVTGTNKGGLSVEVNGIRGFLPISQVDRFRVEQPEQFLNQKLKCIITEVDAESRNLVVSRRALLEKERDEKREQLWAQIEPGQIYEGVVRSVQPFGVFVDIGGADGLVPVQEMSWLRVKDPASVVQPGQRVKVKVLRIDPTARKIALSLRALTASPWETLSQRIVPGEIVKATVTRIAEFGAFAELEPGIEGLIHISELAPHRVRWAGDVVKEGQEVQVKVLNIDAEKQRIALSLKSALAKAAPQEDDEEEEEEVERKPPRPRTTPLRGGIGAEDSPPIVPPEQSAPG